MNLNILIVVALEMLQNKKVEIFGLRKAQEFMLSVLESPLVAESGFLGEEVVVPKKKTPY